MTKKISIANIQAPATIRDGDRVVYTSDGFSAVSPTSPIFNAPVPTMQGETYGYKVGGAYQPPSNYAESDTIKFAFASEGSQTNIGTTQLLGPESRQSQYAAGVSGTEYAYEIGHTTYPTPQPFSIRGATWSINYASDAYALSTIWPQFAGYLKAGSSSPDTGYVFGGYGANPDTTPITTTPYPVSQQDSIVKFPFASSTTPATDVGELAEPGYHGASGTPTDAFLFSRNASLVPATRMIKFNYATETAQTSSFLTFPSSDYGTVVSSKIAGYYAGGTPFPAATNAIHKFPFANDSNGTDVGELVQGVYYSAPSSSTNNGYSLGGSFAPGIGTNSVNSIQKFPFSSDSPATDVGEIGSTIFSNGAGAQV